MLPISTELGDLSYIDIYVDYDGPQLFLCRNKNGKEYLAVHAPQQGENDNWLFVEISPRRISLIERGFVSLFNAFLDAEDGYIYHVVFNGIKASIKKKKPIELPLDWYPAPDVYLDEEARELAAANLRAERIDAARLALNNIIEEGLESPSRMWRMNDRMIEYFRSIKRPVSEVASEIGAFVFDIILRGGERSFSVGASSLGRQLSSLERLNQILIDVGMGGRDRPNVSNLAKDLGSLDAIASFPSSFAMRVAGRDGRFFQHPVVIDATRQFLDLLNSAGSIKSTQEILRHLGGRVALRYKAFISAMDHLDADFSLEIGTPGDESLRVVEIKQVTIKRLNAFLQKEVSAAVDKIEFSGRLSACSLRKKTFTMENEEIVVSGKFPKSLLNKMNGRTLGVEYAAIIEVTTEISESSGVERQKFNLLDIKGD